MKKKEKRMILILFVVSKNKKGNNKENKTEENKVVEEFVQVLEDGTRLNTSSKLNEMKKFKELEFGKIQLINANGQSVCKCI